MVYKELRGNELYVYMNGELLYKRWLKDNRGMVMASSKPSLSRAQGNFRCTDVWQHIN